MAEELLKLEPAHHQKMVKLEDDTDWNEQQEIPEERTNRMFKELGIDTINISKMRGYKRVSEVLKKIGMVEWERGRLVHRQAHLELARIALLDMTVNCQDHKTRVAAAQVLNMICQTENDTAKLDVTLENLAKTAEAAKTASTGLPPAGMQVGLVQNIQVVGPVDTPAPPITLKE